MAACTCAAAAAALEVALRSCAALIVFVRASSELRCAMSAAMAACASAAFTAASACCTCASASSGSSCAITSPSATRAPFFATMRARRPPTSKPSFSSLAGLSAPVISSFGALVTGLTSASVTAGKVAPGATATAVSVLARAASAMATMTARSAADEEISVFRFMSGSVRDGLPGSAREGCCLRE